MPAAPTYPAYDRHLAEVDQALVIWKKSLDREADPKLRRLQRAIIKHQSAYATKLRELLAHCRAQRGRVPKPIEIDASDRN